MKTKLDFKQWIRSAANTRFRLTFVYFIPVCILLIIFSGVILYLQKQQLSNVLLSVDAHIPSEAYFPAYVSDSDIPLAVGEISPMLLVFPDGNQKEYEEMYSPFKDEYESLRKKRAEALNELNQVLYDNDLEAAHKVEQELLGLSQEEADLDQKSGIALLKEQEAFSAEHLGPPVDIFPANVSQDIYGKANVTLLNYTLLLLLFSAILFAIIAYVVAGKLIEPIQLALDKQKQFVADASHELKTPLALMKSEAEILSRSKKQTVDDLRNFTGHVIEDVTRLEILTKNLLQLARFDSGHTCSYLEKVNLNKVISEIFSKYETLYPKLHFSYQMLKKQTIFLGNKEQISQLFTILVDNAAKYSEVGCEIRGIIQQYDHLIVVRIIDNGKGIADKDLPTIFERFTRGSADRSQNGYGLGLSIAQEIINNCQANINIESEIDKGTTVCVNFNLE